jgi:enoyl-CoA hydratase/carnithine racemase
MSRPYFQAGANHLEALFEQYKDDAEQLVALLDELEHRTTAKAIILRGRIANHLAAKASIRARHTPSAAQGQRTDAARITSGHRDGSDRSQFTGE